MQSLTLSPVKSCPHLPTPNDFRHSLALNRASLLSRHPPLTTTEEEYRNRLEQVYRKNFHFLVRHAQARIWNKARAEEMVQEAFVIALERPPSHTDGLARWLLYKLKGVISNSRRAGPDATVAPKIMHEIECGDGGCTGVIKKQICTKCGLAYPKDYERALVTWGIHVARPGPREVSMAEPIEINDPRKQWTSPAVDDEGRLRGGTRTKSVQPEYHGWEEWED